MKRNRKRSREEFEAQQNDEANKELIDNALKDIYEKDEVPEPTKKKVRMKLKSKLNASKSYIKQNKKLINTLMQKYWFSPPQITNITHNTNNHDGDKQKFEISILSIPDHIQQYFFSMLHPKSMYLSLPSVCKWWYHLLNKQTFLHSLCINILKLNPQQIPTPLEIQSIVPFLKKCCLECCSHSTFNDIYGPNTDNTQNMICWKHPICQICFDINPKLQGIYWMNARRKYKLSDYDLYCCQYKKIGRTYLLHSDVIEVGKNKYGDISRIHTLSSLDIAAINSQRKRCYNKKCKELKNELKQWLYAEEEKQNEEDEDIDIEEWSKIELDDKMLKSALNDFFKEHHDGYQFFTGAHCQPTVDNFDRKYMDLVQDMSAIKQLLADYVNSIRKRKYQIKNMSKSEMYNDFYANSWMEGRFGSGYGDYI